MCDGFTDNVQISNKFNLCKCIFFFLKRLQFRHDYTVKNTFKPPYLDVQLK